MDSRIDFSQAAVLCLNSETHPYGSLVSHISWSTTSPLCLDITNMTRYAVVKCIYEQSDSNVYNMGHKRVPLPFRNAGL